jgi:hypothetical protein
MSGPTLRERLKPAELVGMAAIVAVVIGVVVEVVTRGELEFAAVFAIVAFIVSLLALAMLALVSTSGPQDRGADGPVLLKPKPPRRSRR